MRTEQADRSVTAENILNAGSIFKEYGSFIYSVIFYHVKNEVDTEDLFQDFFMTLAEKPIPSDIRNVKGYLYRAITRDILDSMRREKAYNARLNRYANRYKNRKHQDSAETVLIKKDQTQQIIDTADENLPDHIANAFTLRFKGDFTNIEIGKQMGVDAKSVGRYISVGLKKIRKIMEQPK